MPFFHELVYAPIYNLLVFLVDILPGGDLGLAVIGVTVIVKLILMPLSLSAVKTQKEMRVLEPQLKEIRERLKDKKEEQAKEMFALYKTHNVKPFASILLLFLQLPVVFGLYYVCDHVAKSAIDANVLYNFVSVPEFVSPLFLNILPVAGSSLILAVIAGLTQLAYAVYAIPIPPKSKSAKPSMSEDFGHMMALQARFMFPILIGLFSYATGVLAIYFAASNLFMILQEFVSRIVHKTPPTSGGSADSAVGTTFEGLTAVSTISR